MRLIPSTMVVPAERSEQRTSEGQNFQKVTENSRLLSNAAVGSRFVERLASSDLPTLEMAAFEKKEVSLCLAYGE